MSRKTVLHIQKINQLLRKGRDDFHVLLPMTVVKGKGVRGGWRTGEHGVTRFPAINTNKVCTQPMQAEKAERLRKAK